MIGEVPAKYAAVVEFDLDGKFAFAPRKTDCPLFTGGVLSVRWRGMRPAANGWSHDLRNKLHDVLPGSLNRCALAFWVLRFGEQFCKKMIPFRLLGWLSFCRYHVWYNLTTQRRRLVKNWLVGPGEDEDDDEDDDEENGDDEDDACDLPGSE